jgi:hypothetical protein
MTYQCQFEGMYKGVSKVLWRVRSLGSYRLVFHALQRLEEVDPLKGQLIDMRYFGGMTAEESSTALSIPVHTVRRELRLAQAWLRKEMAGDTPCVSAPLSSVFSLVPQV